MAPPYFPFYPRDYMGDIKVRLMTVAERGAYINLLCFAWQDGGTLPNDDGVLAELSGLGSEWSNSRDRILACWQRTHDGLFVFQKRLKHEYDKAVGVVEKRRKAGIASGKSRKLTSNTCSTHVEHTGSGYSSGSDVLKVKRVGCGEREKGFDKFWSVYPRKTAKNDARKAWQKLDPDDTLQDRIIASLDAQKKTPQWKRDGGQFVPHASTWLNGRRWEDEITNNNGKFSGLQEFLDERHGVR